MDSKKYNIYIDESCHLERDNKSVMCIGYTKIDSNKYLTAKEDIKKIKLQNQSPTEIKWSKVSKSRLNLYFELIDYFFANPIEFRCVLIKNKFNLNHEKYNRGSHNDFYYKVIYLLLNNQFTNIGECDYKIYLDIKDTWGRSQLKKLDFYLQKKYNDNSPFKFFQHIRSHENILLQLTDFFIGAVTYKARNEHLKPNASPTKCKIVEYIERKSGYSLDEGTIPWERKFNIFDFQISSANE